MTRWWIAIFAWVALTGCARSPLSSSCDYCSASTCATGACSAAPACPSPACATPSCGVTTCDVPNCTGPAACATRGTGPQVGDWFFGIGANAVPGLGLSVHAGRIFMRNDKITLAAEGEVIAQFIDEETFLDDGNPESDGHFQIKAGVKMSDEPTHLRHWVVRAGLTYFHAGDNPNIVQEEGDYFGAYGSVGLETDLTKNLTFGPDVSLTLASQTDTFKVVAVPTLTWRATWYPCGNRSKGNRPIGEVYVDLMGGVLPTFGGGVGIGQVFSRTNLATWSFETTAVYMPLSDTLQGETDGDFGAFRAGVKATFQPRGCGHWVARAGATFLRNTGDTSVLAQQGDYVGIYAGIGYEWDITPHLSTGPEVLAYIVDQEGLTDIDIEVVPQFLWHVILKF